VLTTPSRRALGLGLACCILGSCLGASPDSLDELPDIVASSKYIDYRTDADVSALCMEDTLAREDRFIDDVAAFLAVDPPTGRIEFVWDPHQSFMENLPDCTSPIACYRYYKEENYGRIISSGFAQYHELVHAVEIPALGERGRILAEGFASYLGSNNNTAPLLPDFSPRFHASLDEPPGDYLVAMHFVGSIIERHGVEKYKQMRRSDLADGDPAEFAELFESIYDYPLADALAEMSAKPIRGKNPAFGCVDDSVETIAWTAPRLIETRIDGQCGDGWFVGPGFIDDRSSGFGKEFRIEILDEGIYEFSLRSTDGSEPHPEGSLSSCETGDGHISLEGLTIVGKFAPGRHVLSVAFPRSDTPRGEAMLHLKRDPAP